MSQLLTDLTPLLYMIAFALCAKVLMWIIDSL